MEFRDNHAIYLQIAEMVCENILVERWKESEKIPSVRELAVSLEVNPNTVARTYEFLTQKDIIFTKRGMGYFVAETGKQKALTYRKDEFLKNDLPLFFQNIQVLNISFDELQTLFNQFKNTQTFNKNENK